MGKKIFLKNFTFTFTFIFIFSLLFFTCISLSAQESDTNTLDKIIKGNEFLLKSNLNLYIGFTGYFTNYLTDSTSTSYYLFYEFLFGYDIFNWLKIDTDLMIYTDFDSWSGSKPFIFFNINFNEIFKSLPINIELKTGTFSQDFSISSYFYDSTPFYYGIAPFYICWEKGALLLNVEWWLLKVSTGIFNFDKLFGFIKGVFSFYDFAFISVTDLFSINIDKPGSFFIELGLTTGLFDILIYFLPLNYEESGQTLPAYSFGANISISFIFSNTHKLDLKIFGDYCDQNSQNGFILIDYINELYYPSNYQFSEKHPTRAGFGIEYNGNFSKNLDITLDLYLYYNFSSSNIVINAYSKIQFYYFYLLVNYFPLYYPVLPKNNFSLSLGINFGF